MIPYPIPSKAVSLDCELLQYPWYLGYNRWQQESGRKVLSPDHLRFGVFEVRLSAHELRKHGVRVRLRGQPFEILRMLLERPGEIVTREEMQARLWPGGTFVDFENSLNAAVKKLRAALGDSPENSRYIETLPRIGYRFVAPVQEWSGTQAPQFRPNDGIVESHLQPALQTAGGGNSKKSYKRHLATGICATLALLAWVAAQRYWPLPAPSVTRATQLTHSGRFEVWGGMRTDGARLYYLERRGSDWNLFQVATAGGEARQIVSPFHSTRILDISPDRAEFLVGSFLAREQIMPLWRIPVLGGLTRRVGDISATDAAWSPDGKRIAYSRNEEIYVADAGGLSSQKLATMAGRSNSLTWNPDGKTIRFTMEDPQTSVGSIWEITADGKNLHKVNFGWDPNTPVCCGRWTADGRYYLFNAQNGDEAGIWAHRETQSILRRKSLPTLLSVGPKSCVQGTAGRGDREVFVSCSEARGASMMYDPRTQHMRPYPEGTGLMDVHVSPGRDQMVFMGDGRTIWISNLDGTGRQQLTFPPMQALRPRWSPDGKQVAFYGWMPYERPCLYVIPAEGGKPKEVLGDEYSQINPDWSPDGQSLVFEVTDSSGGNARLKNALYRVNQESKRVTKVEHSEGLAFPRWSPDGRHIAARTESERELRLLDLRSGDWQVVAKGTLISGVTWSADSEWLYFQDLLAPGETVYRLSVRDGKKEEYASFEKELEKDAIRCALAGILPDGTVVVSVTLGVADIYALDVDFP